ncbi:MAG: hypothetical protein H7070_12955 [Saprospiraceae bacterium]|nr:hypothetical protein [Pyrinomonadaceae bacterium]
MAEIVIETMVCDACGADIRDGSVFCYNCGETVVQTPVEEPPKSGKNGDKAQMSDPAGSEFEKRPVNAEPEKLRSAASLRKRSKAYNRKPAEFVWEKRSGPSPAFTIVTIILLIFTGILLFFAFYLR